VAKSDMIYNWASRYSVYIYTLYNGTATGGRGGTQIIDLPSLSMIVAVAVLLGPIVTRLPVVVSVAVNISLLSTISSFTTETLTNCSESLGAKVTITLLCPMKSAGSSHFYELQHDMLE